MTSQLIRLSAPFLFAAAAFASAPCFSQPNSKAEQNWPQWRGPYGNGVSKATGLPTSWSIDKNVVWKTELPSWSGGTPIVWGDYVFLTSPSKAADSPADTAAKPADAAAPGGRQGRGGYGGRRE